MTRQRIALVLLLVTLATARAASAHVAPSATENNRYIKVTLLPDRARLSYTVFYGERPGAGERQRMDGDANGAIDASESARFGAALRDEIATHVQLQVDGHPAPPADLRVEDVGLGTPVTSGGSFSVDLLLFAPTRGAGAHSLTLTDSWIAPQAGENELLVEESPGVRVVASHLVSEPSATSQMRWSFRGNPAASERAIHVEWTVDDTAYRAAAPSNPAPAHASRRVLWLALAAAAVGGLALLLLARRRP
jgi:hypothetical protein